MNAKFIISVVVLFVLSMALGFVIHATLLNDQYAALPNLYCAADDTSGFPYMIVAHVLIAIGLTWIYRMGRESGKSWFSQGARFGLAIAVVSTIPFYMIYYAVQPAPQSLMMMQIAYDVPAMIVLGIVTAFINK